MSRKHFEKIAETLRIRLQVESLGGESARQAISCIIRALADDFASFNPNFDRNRFLSACGL